MTFLLERPLVRYIEFQISTGNSDEIKKGLQRICQAYRRGLYIGDESQRTALERLINGVLQTHSYDSKIRRWALNSLALLGRKETSLDSIWGAIRRHGDDPQTLASAVAALFKFDDTAQRQLVETEGMDPLLVALSALQQAPVNKVDLSDIRVNVERSEPNILELGLILVGTGKAPRNLFHPRYENGEIVRELGRHHDATVSQYSVWAITENKALNLSNLGIPMNDIESQRPNVRAWMHRLIAISANASQPYLDYIRAGIEDDAVEVREGVAAGLRDTFFSDLEKIGIEWYISETEEAVRFCVLDHIVRQAHYSEAYQSFSLEVYGRAQANSKERARMEAMAAGTPIYSKLVRTKIEGQSDLFEVNGLGGTVGGGTTVNIAGDLIIGDRVGIIKGNASGNQFTNVEIGKTGGQKLGEEQLREIVSHFKRALAAVDELDMQHEAKAHLKEAIEEAVEDPTPGRIRRALGSVVEVADRVGGVTGPVQTLMDIVELVKPALT